MKIPAIPSPQIGPEYTYMGRYQWASHIKPKVHVPRYPKSRPSMVCPQGFPQAQCQKSYHCVPDLTLYGCFF